MYLQFQANLYFLLGAALSSASHRHLKRPLALAPRCSAASKIITLKVGQRDLDFTALMCRCPDAELESSLCCAFHAVKLFHVNLWHLQSHQICYVIVDSFLSSTAGIVFTVLSEQNIFFKFSFDFVRVDVFLYECCIQILLCFLSVTRHQKDKIKVTCCLRNLLF